ncbi:MAG: hypothetical protein AAFU77_14975 [Myxococcota bacterium]
MKNDENPYRPPGVRPDQLNEEPVERRRPIASLILHVMAGAVGLYALIIGVLIVARVGLDPRSILAAPFSFMSIAFWAAIAIALRNKARQLADPVRFSPKVLHSEELQSIYRSENLESQSHAETASATYAGTSDQDLIDVFHHIDRDAHPGRYGELLAEIKKRVEHSRL